MRTLPSNLRDETLKQHNASPWIWLYEIELEATTVATPTAFLAGYTEEITWKGNTYYPFPIAHEPFSSDSEGNLPQTILMVSNVTREFTRYLQTSKGMEGRAVKIILIHKDVAALNQGLEFDFEVASSAADDQAITLNLQPPGYFSIGIPSEYYVRNRCRFRFKSPGCGYRGTNTECDKTIDGPKGCKVQGDDEIIQGLPRQHPSRYGGFPAIPRVVR